MSRTRMGTLPFLLLALFSFMSDGDYPLDVCCIQETRYRGGNCRTIKGKDTRYWSGNDKGTACVGMFVAEEWIKFLRFRGSPTESSS